MTISSVTHPRGLLLNSTFTDDGKVMIDKKFSSLAGAIAASDIDLQRSIA